MFLDVSGHPVGAVESADRRELLTDLLHAALDLANVGQVLVEASAIRRGQLPLKR